MDLKEFKKKLSDRQEKLSVNIIDPLTQKKLIFSVSNEMTLYRARSLFEKEPITIELIRGFESVAIFYDIGANVGIYSIFAAVISQSNVYSFEPEANNFQTLMENIVLNNLMNKISAYPIGISNITSLSTLYLNRFDKGSSHHVVGEPIDHNLKETKIKLKQGIFSTSIDRLWGEWRMPEPNHIKIDVDGIEYKIIEKSKKTLLNKKLKSVLIEINPNREKDKIILNTMLDFGFKYNQNQVENAKRKSGMHEGYAEYLFYKI